LEPRLKGVNDGIETQCSCQPKETGIHDPADSGTLNDLIDAGELAAGTLLPSERELANTLKVARNVVRGAYEQLMDAGKLSSEGRKGRSVSSGRSSRSTTKKRSTGKASKKGTKARKK